MTADADIAPVVLLDPTAIDHLRWEPLDGARGVSYRLLWRSGKSVAGIMRLDPGASVEPHVHHHSHHHIWVVTGSTVILGRTLTPGSYVHIPAGVTHGMTSLEPEGCRFLYLYVREPIPATEAP